MITSPLKLSYIDLDSGAWLASRTRRQLDDPRLWGLYWEIIHQINESDGELPFDRDDLLLSTKARPEELDRILGIHHFQIKDGILTHAIVSAKFEGLRKRLGWSSEGGKASGATRRAKAAARKESEKRSHFEGTSDDFRSKRNEGIDGEMKERSSRARAEVKPGAPSAPEDQPPLKFSPHPPTRAEAPLETATGFDPERLQRIIRGSRPSGPADRDQRRPWVSKAFGNWFERLTIPEKCAIGAAWEKENPGIGFDTGPIATTTRARPSNGSGEGGSVPAGAPARSEDGIAVPTSGPEFDGGEI